MAIETPLCESCLCIPDSDQVDKSERVAYYHTLYDLIDYGDTNELTNSSLVVFVKLLGLPYHDSALLEMLEVGT
eukprot:4465138-Pyramimonas_sp.AAC.1